MIEVRSVAKSFRVAAAGMRGLAGLGRKRGADRVCISAGPAIPYFGGVGAGVGWAPDCFSSCSRC